MNSPNDDANGGARGRDDRSVRAALNARAARGTARGADTVFDQAAPQTGRGLGGRVWMAVAAAAVLVIGALALARFVDTDDRVTIGATTPEPTDDADDNDGNDDDRSPTETAPPTTSAAAELPLATSPPHVVEGSADDDTAVVPETLPPNMVSGSTPGSTPGTTGPATTAPATTAPATTAPATTEPVGAIDPALLFESGEIAADWVALPGGLVVATIEPRPDSGTAFLRSIDTTPFDGERLVVEFATTAGNQTHGASVWPEIVLTPAPAPTSRRSDALFAVDAFSGAWTLGCRLESARTPVCTLLNDSDRGVGDGGREWQASFFELAGTDSFGGTPDDERADAWRTCPEASPSDRFDYEACLDRFRLELTPTSLTLYVNDVRYFEQTGIPPMPAALLESSYVYRAVGQSRSELASVAVYWQD